MVDKNYQEAFIGEISDVGAERAVLGGLVKYGFDCYADVSDLIRPTSFSGDSNKVIYQCIKTAYDKDKDVIIDAPIIETTAAQIGYAGFFDKIDERKYLRAILNCTVAESNVRKLAGVVAKLEVGRLLNEQLKLSSISLSQINGSESVGHILGLVENPIFDLTSLLSNSSENKVEPVGVGAVEYFEYLKANPRQLIGISSGYSLYDFAIGGGYRPGTVNLIGARTKAGKTFLGINIGLFVSRVLNIPVLYLDTEMQKEDHLHRSCANLSTTEINNIERGMFGDRDKFVMDAARELESNSYTFENISGISFEDVISIMRRWINKAVGTDENGNTKPCLIIYDYLKLTNSEGISASMQEYQMLGFQMTALHNFMVKYKVPCAAFIQLNRDGITKETSDAISGSDRIAWLCSNLSIFKAKSEEEIMEDGLSNGNRKLIVVLARHGEGLQDGDYINMQADLKYGQIKELNTRSQIHGKNQGGKILGSDNNDDSTDFDSPVPF